ncbi:MAG TPA: SDR family oxidoreductase [Gemmataceae bacterium]|nr:SDR family oxidoreductase [Gemmataceae bacterium]
MNVLDKFRLDGKRALVTGGSRGLGRAMAQALAEAGADLVLVGTDPNNLLKAHHELLPLGRRVDVVEADLFLPDQTESMCERVLANHGPIDILVNNVGGRRQNVATEEMPLEMWQRHLDLNLTSVFLCTKLVGGAMLARKWGRVINIASICGQIATRGIFGRHYETAKAAVVGFTRAVAADWAPHGVTVNAIAPGGFMTDANRRWFREKPELRQVFEGQVPMGRLGEPEEIGPLAVYLASEASSYMTGATLVIDGGYTVW